MHEPGPVTIGDLRRSGKALEIGCMNCDRHGPTPWRCLTCSDASDGSQAQVQPVRFPGSVCATARKPGHRMILA